MFLGCAHAHTLAARSRSLTRRVRACALAVVAAAAAAAAVASDAGLLVFCCDVSAATATAAAFGPLTACRFVALFGSCSRSRARVREYVWRRADCERVRAASALALGGGTLRLGAPRWWCHNRLVFFWLSVYDLRR